MSYMNDDTDPFGMPYGKGITKEGMIKAVNKARRGELRYKKQFRHNILKRDKKMVHFWIMEMIDKETDEISWLVSNNIIDIEIHSVFKEDAMKLQKILNEKW